MGVLRRNDRDEGSEIDNLMNEGSTPFDESSRLRDEEVRRSADKARVAEILSFYPNSPLEMDDRKIARVRKLLEQDGYPAPSVIDCISRLLARHWPTDPAAGF
jgi:hypothetical protein